jgi:hypothetical protein
MPVIIRVAGVIWVALFSLICLTCLALPSFLPVGWPSAVPIPVRFIGLVIYLLANLVAGGYATTVAFSRPYAAAMALCCAVLVFTVIMLAVTLALEPHAHGANWQAHAVIGTLIAATSAGAVGITVLVAGIRTRHRRQRPSIPAV